MSSSFDVQVVPSNPSWLPPPPIHSRTDYYLKLILSVISNDVTEISPECFSLLSRGERYISWHLGNEPVDELFLEAVFCCLEAAPCRDKQVVRGTLQDYLLLNCRKLTEALDNRTDFQTPPIRYHFQPSPADLLPSVRLWVHGVSIWGGGPLDFFYISRLLMNFRIVKRLVRYGVPFAFCSEQIHPCFFEQLNMIKSLVMPLHFPGLRFRRSHFFGPYPTLPTRRRLIVVLWILIRSAHDCSFCRVLPLLFRTMTEPFVTCTEIARFLNLMLEGDDKPRQIEAFCDLIVRDFPHAGRSLRPRSLKHLSRCAVRRCMADNACLPSGVWSLHIPKELQNYLLLQHSETEHYPELFSVSFL